MPNTMPSPIALLARFVIVSLLTAAVVFVGLRYLAGYDDFPLTWWLGLVALAIAAGLSECLRVTHGA